MLKHKNFSGFKSFERAFSATFPGLYSNYFSGIITFIKCRRHNTACTFYFLLFTFYLLSACTREQLDDCFTSTGPQITEDRPVSAFNSIELYDNVNLVLLSGTEPELRVEGGKNVIDAVKTDINDSTLIIHNTMTCNWVRNFKKELTVYVTVTGLYQIRYEGSGDISTQSQLTFDSLQVNVWGGAGSFNLDLNVTNLKLALHYGTVDFNIKGNALITTIFANSYGPFYCDGLMSNIVYIRNSGTNNCYVHARDILEVEITSVGDIYYSGDPYDVKSNITGSGKFVKIE
ncbi:MAG: DUF2807 domain-containing protein [Lentimicrobium sp.]|nr:DUF2807 domain-containing protein [Lentimicrobium sp.]